MFKWHGLAAFETVPSSQPKVEMNMIYDKNKRKISIYNLLVLYLINLKYKINLNLL